MVRLKDGDAAAIAYVERDGEKIELHFAQYEVHIFLFAFRNLAELGYPMETAVDGNILHCSGTGNIIEFRAAVHRTAKDGPEL